MNTFEYNFLLRHLVALLVQEQERISLPLKQLKQVLTSPSTPLKSTREKVENVVS